MLRTFTRFSPNNSMPNDSRLEKVVYAADTGIKLFCLRSDMDIHAVHFRLAFFRHKFTVKNQSLASDINHLDIFSLTIINFDAL